jgi:hypothetical protein
MRRREGIRVVAALSACALVLSACGGRGERQDAKEPEGTFKVEVTDASFPSAQSIAEASKLKIAVRNADSKTVPNVAVTIQTKPKDSSGAAQAFAQDTGDSSLADSARPVWILEEGPKGGDTAYTNTWALGPLKAGETRDFEWKVTAVKAGEYDVDYAVFPGLNGKAKPADGSGAGSFHVVIDDEPPAARVDDDGNVVREKSNSED